MYIVMAIILITRPYGLFGREERAGDHGQQGAPQQPIRPAGTTGRLRWGLLLLALALIPVVADSYILVLLVDVIVLSLFAASLHFILGIGGMVSFGHAAFFGGGVYAGALLVTYAQTPMELAMLLAPLCAGLLAIVIGWFCIRLTGVYMAMLTLAFAQLLWSVAYQWTEVMRGDDGLLNIWPSAWAASPLVYYYLTLVLGVGGILVLRHVTHSPFGYALRGTRDSELRAEATGINARLVRWAAFTFAGVMAGLAGAIYVFAKGSAFPNELEIARSFDAIIMVFFGGVQHLSGPFVGASVFTLLEDALSRFEYWRLCLGLAIIAVVIVAPEGIAGGLQRLAERAGLRRREERA
jgi:branched-chain amino acid transport system permease protein